MPSMPIPMPINTSSASSFETMPNSMPNPALHSLSAFSEPQPFNFYTEPAFRPTVAQSNPSPDFSAYLHAALQPASATSSNVMNAASRPQPLPTLKEESIFDSSSNLPNLDPVFTGSNEDDPTVREGRERDLAATAALVARDMQASKEGTFTPLTSAPSSLGAQISGLSGRMSLGDGGQLRYYGPTSNRHLSLGGAPPPHVQSNEDLNAASVAALTRAGEKVETNSKLENRLLSLYFIWHNSFFYVVHPDLFMKHRDRYLAGQSDCPFFSLTLYYAILAYSAIFSDEAVALANGIVEKSGDVYSRKARICLEAEMDYPRETTVQALAILGSYEVCVGRDARG